MLKEKRGITLIALVITIIVLLILAGVSISALTGESGIINKARKAKEATEMANLKDEVNLKLTEYKLQNEHSVKYYLGEIPNATVESVKEDTFYVTRGNTTVTVYETGELVEGKAVWDLTSKCPEFKEFNWYIYTPSQFKFLADYVNNGRNLTEEQKTMVVEAGYKIEDVTMTADTIVYLMNDIDLGARETNGEWETEDNEKVKWIPIGNASNILIATFEGNNNTIRGVYINSDAIFNGIFGVVDSVKNLTVENSYIVGASATGGIAGALRKQTAENCHNVNSTVVLKEGQNLIVGGIIGQVSSNAKVINCSNKGKIISFGVGTNGNSQAGGVVGAGLSSSIISNCYNLGVVESVERYTGGVIGSADSSSVVENCYNRGTVTGQGRETGGVVGGANNFVTIKNCYNVGEVIGENKNTGGVIGSANSSSTIINCYNTGSVKGTQYTGGIVGILPQSENVTNSKIEKCYNSGSVNGTQYTGGIIGYLSGNDGQGTVIDCYNKGQVNGTTEVGSIIGVQTNTTGLNTLYNLYYLNTVGIGAINGVDDESNNIMATNQDIASYEKFLEWIQNQ